MTFKNVLSNNPLNYKCRWSLSFSNSLMFCILVITEDFWSQCAHSFSLCHSLSQNFVQRNITLSCANSLFEQLFASVRIEKRIQIKKKSLFNDKLCFSSRCASVVARKRIELRLQSLENICVRIALKWHEKNIQTPRMLVDEWSR